MLTINLTIDADTLDALQRGEAITLKAMGKRPRPRAKRELTPEEQGAFKRAATLWAEAQPDVPVARAMKALQRIGNWEDALVALDTALDWNRGRSYPPEWFAKDLPQWMERAAKFAIDPFGYEIDRAAYRARFGLK